MSHSLLAFNPNEIKFEPGRVSFKGYEDLKHQATVLADEIKKVEVTEENVQVSKKMLAAVNKRVKEISDKRISIKKEILESYNEFEQQVKEITSIVKVADNHVRNQVRQLEEMEREKKRDEIEEIFHKRIKHYSFNDVFNFDDFITPKHLNKSTSMKSVESDMVEWLEKKDADVKVIQSLPNSSEVLTEYLDTKDLSIAINIVNQRHEYMEKLEKTTPVKKDNPKTYTINLFDEKDYKLVEMFMIQNNIDYSLQK